MRHAEFSCGWPNPTSSQPTECAYTASEDLAVASSATGARTWVAFLLHLTVVLACIAGLLNQAQVIGTLAAAPTEATSPSIQGGIGHFSQQSESTPLAVHQGESDPLGHKWHAVEDSDEQEEEFGSGFTVATFQALELLSIRKQATKFGLTETVLPPRQGEFSPRRARAPPVFS